MLEMETGVGQCGCAPKKGWDDRMAGWQGVWWQSIVAFALGNGGVDCEESWRGVQGMTGEHGWEYNGRPEDYGAQ